MSDESEEWGPWVEHDGKWKPKPGVWVHRLYADGSELIGPMGGYVTASEIGAKRYNGETFASSWIWGDAGRYVPVARYRIRKPKALRDLISLVENLPKQKEQTREHVGVLK